MAPISASRLLARALVKLAFTFENASSMEFRSGEYGGRNNKPAALRFYELAHLLSLVCRQVVHHYALALLQRGRQGLLDVRLENLSGRRSLDRHARPHALGRHTR